MGSFITAFEVEERLSELVFVLLLCLSFARSAISISTPMKDEGPTIAEPVLAFDADALGALFSTEIKLLEVEVLKVWMDDDACCCICSVAWPSGFLAYAGLGRGLGRGLESSG